MTASIACFPLLLWLHSHSASLLTGLSTLWHASVRSVSSITQSCPALSDPMDCRHTKLHCPSPAPGAWSNSCPSSQWCHPAISSSVVPFSSCPQPLPASGFFNMSQFFTSGGQSIGVSASASVLPMNIQDWFPLGWTGWISLPSRIFSKHHSSKASILQCSAFYLCFCKYLLMFFYFLLIPEFIIICPRPKLFFQLVCVI